MAYRSGGEEMKMLWRCAGAVSYAISGLKPGVIWRKPAMAVKPGEKRKANRKIVVKYAESLAFGVGDMLAAAYRYKSMATAG